MTASTEWDHGRIWLSVVVFAFLLVAWPNAVHEPAHLAALWLQGSDGYIDFDMSFPAHPSTTRTAPVAGLAGGFFFLLAPSLLSVIILAVLWVSRHKGRYWSHFVLASYLCFDLVINVLGYRGIASDFRFLQAVPMPHAWAVISSTAVVWFFLALLWYSDGVSHLVRPKAVSGGDGDG